MKKPKAPAPSAEDEALAAQIERQTERERLASITSLQRLLTGDTRARQERLGTTNATLQSIADSIQANRPAQPTFAPGQFPNFRIRA